MKAGAIAYALAEQALDQLVGALGREEAERLWQAVLKDSRSRRRKVRTANSRLDSILVALDDAEAVAFPTRSARARRLQIGHFVHRAAQHIRRASGWRDAGPVVRRLASGTPEAVAKATERAVARRDRALPSDR